MIASACNSRARNPNRTGTTADCDAQHHSILVKTGFRGSTAAGARLSGHLNRQARDVPIRVKQRTERHLTAVRAKIADLQRIEQVLATTAAPCSGEDVPDCPVLEALAS